MRAGVSIEIVRSIKSCAVTEALKSYYKSISHHLLIEDVKRVDEINTILNASEGQVRLLFQFAFFTGLRVSELIGLRWEDVDWQNQLIHVEETIVAKELKGPKTEAIVLAFLFD